MFSLIFQKNFIIIILIDWYRFGNIIATISISLTELILIHRKLLWYLDRNDQLASYLCILFCIIIKLLSWVYSYSLLVRNILIFYLRRINGSSLKGFSILVIRCIGILILYLLLLYRNISNKRISWWIHLNIFYLLFFPIN
jgi:hypothetical protein